MSNLITTNTSNDMFEVMDKAYKFANIFAKSDIVPAHYRGKPENTFIAVQTAYRMNLDPMLIMQNTYVTSGKLGMNSAFAISLANTSGIFDGGMRYRVDGSGEELKVMAYANLKKTGEEISYTISMKDATAEGWTKNSKYKTLPELMLRYRAAIFLIRTHVPEVLNGMHMVEEIEDTLIANDIKIVGEEGSIKEDHLQLEKKSKTELLKDFLSQKEEEKEKKQSDSSAEEHKFLVDELRTIIVANNVPSEEVERWLDKAHVDDISELKTSELKACINFVNSKYVGV